MFENGSRNSAMAQAKFASLDAAYASFRAHEGTAKPSLPDYLALTSGQYSGKGTFGGSPSGHRRRHDRLRRVAGEHHGAARHRGLLVEGIRGGRQRQRVQPLGHRQRRRTTRRRSTCLGTAPPRSTPRPAAPASATATAATTSTSSPPTSRTRRCPTSSSSPPTPSTTATTTAFAPANTWLNSGGSWGGIDNLIASMRTGGLLAITFDNVPTPDTTVPITGTGIVYLVVAGRASPTPPTRRRAPTSRSSKAIQSFFGVSNFSVGVDSHYTSATAVTLPSTGGGGGGGGGGAGAAPLITVAYNNATPRFVNAAGDQVLLRGVNLTMSSPSSFQNLAAGMGLNCVRLVCNWTASRRPRPPAAAPTTPATPTR
jgi:hypothetical protein